QLSSAAFKVMRTKRAKIAEGLQVCILDHQGFQMLLQVESNLCGRGGVSEERNVSDYFIEIEKFHGLKGTPYFLPASRQIWTMKDIYEGPLQTGGTDSKTRAVDR